MESNSPESFGVRVRGSGVKMPHPGPYIGRYARDKGAEPQSPYEMA